MELNEDPLPEVGPSMELMFSLGILDDADAEALVGERLDERDNVPCYEDVIPNLEEAIGELQVLIKMEMVRDKQISKSCEKINAAASEDSLKEKQRKDLQRLSEYLSNCENTNEVQYALTKLSNMKSVYEIVERSKEATSYSR